VSSNSCAPDGPLVALVAESLRCLEREAGAHHQAVCTHLAGRALRVQLDGEQFNLCSDGAALRLEPAGPATCALRSGRAAILALVADRLALLDALLTDQVVVVGPLAELLIFHEALTDFLHGAVRSPSFLGLLRRLQALNPIETVTTRDAPIHH
jgi:hypothetical protein